MSYTADYPIHEGYSISIFAQVEYDVLGLAGAVEECKVKPSGEPPYAGLSLAGAALVCAFLAGRWSL